MKKNITKIILIILILLFINMSLKLIMEELKNKKKIMLETKSIEYTLNKKIGTPNEKNEIIEYELILEIPKINLKKGILKKEDENNNIDKNVTILKESNYPNEKGNIYLAAHSGNGKQSYFNDLIKLGKKDKAILYYKNKKYIYYVEEIKEINKSEQISLLTTSSNNLILITCSQTNKNKYIIILLKK